MAAPKMTRHEMKQDELVTAIERAGGYLTKHPAALRNGGIVGGIVIVLGVSVFLFLENRTSSAAQLLREAQSRYGAQVGGDGSSPNDPVPTYPNEAERDRAALDSFSQIVSRYGGRREGRLGLYYQGLLLARLGKTEEAEAAFTHFLQKPSSSVLAGIARTQLALLRAKRGDLDGAAKIYSELAEETNPAYPRDFALYYLAETLRQQGKPAEAAATYRKIVTEFPNSPMAAEAGRKAESVPTS